MINIASIIFMKITKSLGKRAFSDRLLIKGSDLSWRVAFRHASVNFLFSDLFEQQN